MGVLTNAPLGFSSAVSTLNSIPQGILAEMVSTQINIMLTAGILQLTVFCSAKTPWLSSSQMWPIYPRSITKWSASTVKSFPKSSSILYLYLQALSGLDISPKPDAGNCLNALTFLFK